LGKLSQSAEEGFLAKCEAIVFTSEVDFERCHPPPAVPPAAAVNLYENIERLKLDVDRIVPLHGRIVRLEDLKKTIGK
jgi:hypothetical protein